MNSKNKLKKKFVFSIYLFLIAILTFKLIEHRFKSGSDNKILGTTVKKEDVSKLQKMAELTEKFVEISPDGTKQVILYERPFLGEGQLDYHNYLSNQYLFAVRDLDSWREHYVFVGDDKVGYPHWLGNNFIFFTAGCGTGCKSLYLVDTRSKESFSAIVTTTPISKNGFKTHFRDWFDSEFNFAGWMKHMRAVTIKDKTYLIFEIWNNNQPIGEKRFIFTGKKLVEE
jgi:hypothetical protein